MTEQPHLQPTDILGPLEGIDELPPSEELAVYEQVLADLTELLNAPDEHAPGDV